jgi:hypothetical protein
VTKEADFTPVPPLPAPENIEEWTNKHFVVWFLSRCKKFRIEFIVMWRRDEAQVNLLRGDLRGCGHPDKATLRDFLEWAFAHREEVVREKKSFTLVTVRHFLNRFLQEKDPVVERHLFADVVAEMRATLGQGQPVGTLLARFGIPLAANFMRRAKPQTTEFDIVAAIRGRLEASKDLLAAAAKRSIDNSPYPDSFLLLDWREQFGYIIEQNGFNRTPWWRATDSSGGFDPQYLRLLPEERKGEISNGSHEGRDGEEGH